MSVHKKSSHKNCVTIGSINLHNKLKWNSDAAISEANSGDDIENNVNEILQDAYSAVKADENEVVDSDLYTFKYWDNTKDSNVDEALAHIRSSLNQSFLRNNVDESNRILKKCYAKHVEDNVIEVSVHLKKDIWLVEKSARGIQIPYDPGKPINVSLKNIERWQHFYLLFLYLYFI